MKDIIAAVEKHSRMILDAERYIWKHPETGYREVETSAYMEENFRKLGYDLVMAENITGFYTVLDTGRPGPTVLVMAELDSILCPEHCPDPAGSVYESDGGHQPSVYQARGIL